MVDRNMEFVGLDTQSLTMCDTDSHVHNVA